MLHILVRHKVSDFTQWKKSYDGHAVRRRAAGLTDVHVFRNLDDPSEVTLLFAAADLEKARAFTESDDLHAAMQNAGVTDKPDIYFLS